MAAYLAVYKHIVHSTSGQLSSLHEDEDDDL
jgi:hypothetical protein